ncbi:hypothetical protein JQM69_02115 [Faecalicatena contorta]|nr:hypothetical protein [Faecalicatena contorta]MCF2679508.1 hypothetical protein [Faecalicatena contorta]
MEENTDQIMRREFNMLFDSFEAYDVQETRRISREEERIRIICKMIQKDQSAAEIADLLDESEHDIQKICGAAAKYAPDYDTDKILKELEI